MTREEMMALKDGEFVVHASGNTYKVVRLYDGYRPQFVQQRDGQNYGPIRTLSAKAIELAPDKS